MNDKHRTRHEEQRELQRQKRQEYHAIQKKRYDLGRKLHEQQYAGEKEIMEQLHQLNAKYKSHRDRHFNKEQHYYHEFDHYYRRIRYTKPISFVLVAILWALFFWFGGVNTSLGIGIFVFAIIITLSSVFQTFILMSIEKRILKPIENLQKGVDEIAKGNYEVNVSMDCGNEIRSLINDFNGMARKLGENEKLKAEYEENRKLLIANISHDLKTPITSVLGYIEAIGDAQCLPPEKMDYYLKIISGNITYMNKLIDDLFLFSKLDMQKLPFEFEEIEIRPLMRDLMEELKLDLEERQAELTYTDEMKQDCRVLIDAKRFNQIIRNILGNAVKYGPGSSLMIAAQLYNDENVICIAIHDNGPGIPSDKIGSIFDRFYRLDNERTKDISSTGLGLAIAKELVEAHGGAIKAQSSQTEGTCFTISLPIVSEHADPENAADSGE